MKPFPGECKNTHYLPSVPSSSVMPYLTQAETTEVSNALLRHIDLLHAKSQVHVQNDPEGTTEWAELCDQLQAAGRAFKKICAFAEKQRRWQAPTELWGNDR